MQNKMRDKRNKFKCVFGVRQMYARFQKLITGNKVISARSCAFCGPKDTMATEHVPVLPKTTVK